MFIFAIMSSQSSSLCSSVRFYPFVKSAERAPKQDAVARVCKATLVSAWSTCTISRPVSKRRAAGLVESTSDSSVGCGNKPAQLVHPEGGFLCLSRPLVSNRLNCRHSRQCVKEQQYFMQSKASKSEKATRVTTSLSWCRGTQHIE